MTLTTHINGEEVIELSGFKLDTGEILISDANSLGNFEKVRVILEPSQLKFWIEDGRLDDFID